MAQIIQHNIQSLNSYNRLSTNNTLLSKNLEKLSSGYKINRAGDDAAGLAISQKMRAQITGLERASANAQDGISLVQTAEGALTEVHSMLNRMVELATQSSNGTYDNTDRSNLQKEIESIRDEIDRISNETNFNGIKLLDGSMGGGAVTADGAVFTGSEVAKYLEASASVAVGDWSSAETGDKDTFVIDGQALVIDWSKGDAKKVQEALAINHSSVTYTADGMKELAQKIEDLFNDEMKAQGLTGSVKITNATTTGFKIESTNKTASSEVSYAGSNSSDPTKAFGAMLFGTSTAKGESSINQATKTYNGNTLAGNNTTEAFNMIINGVTVNVASPAVTKGTTTMAAAASALETAIQAAVGNYNSAMGLTAGTKDTESGLTGLTTSDFTVVEEDGAFKIEYSGDEDVVFSFSDIGDRTTAQTLGLTGGSSASGGAGGLSLQIGDTATQRISVSVNDMDSNSLGIGSINISTEQGATASIDKIKTAINSVSSTRADLGAIQNRLEYTINNLATTTENLTSAESRIRDTDMAKEMMAYTKNNVLSQAAQAMLAQANQQPQQILQLLQ